MTKTFYAVEIHLWKITADVNHNDVTIDVVHHPPKREPVLSHYRGSFTKEGAEAAYRRCNDVVATASR